MKGRIMDTFDKVYSHACSREDWQEFIRVMHSGQPFEVDEEMWEYWLEVLPPVLMNKEITFMPGHEGHPVKVDFGFAEGNEQVTVFWRSPDGKRYFGQRTARVNSLS